MDEQTATTGEGLGRVDAQTMACWRANYGLHATPHALHRFWGPCNAPAGAVLALRAAVIEIELLQAELAAAHALLRGVRDARSGQRN